MDGWSKVQMDGFVRERMEGRTGGFLTAWRSGHLWAAWKGGWMSGRLAG